MEREEASSWQDETEEELEGFLEGGEEEKSME